MLDESPRKLQVLEMKKRKRAGVLERGAKKNPVKTFERIQTAITGLEESREERL